MRSAPLRVAGLALLLLVGAGCGSDGGGSTVERPAPEPTVPERSAPVALAPEVRQRADELISVFENGTIEIDYGYVEDLGDGRGYTAGRAGFTTATGDVLEVVEAYVGEEPGAELAAFLPELERLAAAGSDDTEGLRGFPRAWGDAAIDPAFRDAQDAVVDRLYFEPAMARADELGLRLELSRVALYEAIIQHGEGDDPDGLPALTGRTTEAIGGTPAEGEDEEAWLERFLEVRRADLLDPDDPATREEWRASVGRADELLRIFRSGNLAFEGPITVAPFGDPVTLA